MIDFRQNGRIGRSNGRTHGRCKPLPRKASDATDALCERVHATRNATHAREHVRTYRLVHKVVMCVRCVLRQYLRGFAASGHASVHASVRPSGRSRARLPLFFYFQEKKK